MSTSLEKLESKLLAFDPAKNSCYSIDEFIRINNDLTSDDIKKLGDKYKMWKLGCLYHFLLSSKYKTNLTYMAPVIIKKFQELKASAANNGGDQDLVKILYSSTRINDYLKFLNE